MARKCFYRIVNVDAETLAYCKKLKDAVSFIEARYTVISVKPDRSPNRLHVRTSDGDLQVLPVAFQS